MRVLLRYSRKKLVRMSLRKLLPPNQARYQFFVGALQPLLPAADTVFVDEFGVDPLALQPQYGWCVALRRRPFPPAAT